MYIVLDNYGSHVVFTDMKTALNYMKNTALYDKKYFARLYESKEVFNTDDFDMKSIREKS